MSILRRINRLKIVEENFLSMFYWAKRESKAGNIESAIAKFDEADFIKRIEYEGNLRLLREVINNSVYDQITRNRLIRDRKREIKKNIDDLYLIMATQLHLQWDYQ